MHVLTAGWAFLLTPTLRQLLGRGLLFACRFLLFSLDLSLARRIGLLDRALRVDAARGVRSLSANGADLAVRFTKDGSRLLMIHDSPTSFAIEQFTDSVEYEQIASVVCVASFEFFIQFIHGGLDQSDVFAQLLQSQVLNWLPGHKDNLGDHQIRPAALHLPRS